ncbi:carboxypeptidase regulatory-like domain-containing protein [bacterium]|nr:carboxypeptidase regulatory-like domain-containing protein [bacterium]
MKKIIGKDKRKTKLFCYLVVLLFTGASVVNATVTYNGTRIMISNGAESLTTINQTLNDPSLLEQVSAKEWLLKVPVYVAGSEGALYINNSDCDLLKIKALPSPIVIEVRSGGSIVIDNTDITGWDMDNNTDITITDNSPSIESWYNNDLNASNTYFKHIQIRYIYDETPDTIDNCTFFESNTVGISSYYSLHKTITHNKFIDCYHCSYKETNWDGVSEDVYTYTNFSYNYCIGHDGYSIFSDNVQIGSGSTIIGNEIILGGWNIINRGTDTLLKDNIIHDNAGHHNGFNPGGARAKYITHINDYAYNIENYTGFYFQRSDSYKDTHFPQYERIINSVAENCSAGFLTFYMYNSYLYNFTSINNGGNTLLWNSRNVTFERCNISGSSWGGMEFVGSSSEGYPDNCMFINSRFSNNQPADIAMKLNNFNGIIYSINTYNETTMDVLTIRWSFPKGEFRDYVWLDVLVQDENSNPIQEAIITIENLTDINSPALNIVPVESFLDINAIINRTDWGNTMLLPNKQDFTRITTNSNGHTPLPQEGHTVALMFQKRTSSEVTSEYSYKITAAKGEYNNSLIVNPDSSWYRSEPNIYQHTVTIVLPMETGVVSGIVTDTSGIPVAEATIVAHGYTTTTDTTGYYTMSLPVGNCMVTVSKDKYFSQSKQAKIVVDEITTLNFQLICFGSSNKVFVYPNPYIKGKSLYKEINFTNLPRESMIKIYTISGLLVKTIQHNEIINGGSGKWDISGIASGTYIYSITSSQGEKKGKISIIK